MNRLSRISSDGIFDTDGRTSFHQVSIYLNTIFMKGNREYISVIHHCIMSASHSKVVVDHEGDLSSSKKPILLLGFLFLETDLLLELGILV